MQDSLIKKSPGNPQINFARRLVYLDKQLIKFDRRPYLPEIYEAALSRDVVLRAGRQVEKSTLLCNKIIFDAIRMPGRQILYVCPRQEQALGFSKNRLRPAVQNSPLVRRSLWPFKRENWLGRQIFAPYEAILANCYDAWNQLIVAQWRVMSFELHS